MIDETSSASAHDERESRDSQRDGIDTEIIRRQIPRSDHLSQQARKTRKKACKYCDDQTEGLVRLFCRWQSVASCAPKDILNTDSIKS